MFLMDYSTGKGWHDARIVPYGPISLSPAASVLHYGTEVFEGLKAYRRPDGGVQLFRPWENVAPPEPLLRASGSAAARSRRRAAGYQGDRPRRSAMGAE